MFRVAFHLCGLVMFLVLADSVCDKQIVFRAKTQKTFTVWVALPNSTRANHTRPFVHLFDSGIQVTGYYQFISTRNTLQNFSQVFVEFLLNLFGVSYFWNLDMVIILSLTVVGSISSCWVMEFPIAKPSLDSLHSLSPATPKRACSHDLPCCHTTAIESHLALLYRCYNSQVLCFSCY